MATKAKKKKSRDSLYEECKVELLRLKREAEDFLKSSRSNLGAEMAGDEGDIAQNLNDQRQAFVKRQMTEKRLVEVKRALERLTEGTYGECEETGEEIEEKRLLLMPWTRFSREGAEIREREDRRYGSRDNSDDDMDVTLNDDDSDT